MIDKHEILKLVKEKGPVIPRELVVEVGGDTFLVGALLSQMVDNKEIKISHTKIGGSPTYYVQGQEEKLQDLYKHLHEKEKRAYDLLKQQKIIRDRTAEPPLRVALRNIKDFAKALEVNINGEREIFWKWYLFPNSESENKIREILGKPKKQKSKQQPSEPKEEPKEPVKEEKQEVQEQLPQETVKEEEPKQEPKQKELEAGLFAEVKKLFEEKAINIIETNVIRKNADIELEIEIPSPVGNLNYFCKIKKKKKVNDKDLSSVFVEGQMKKLPILYVTTGELTKKAQNKLETEFKTISVLKV